MASSSADPSASEGLLLRNQTFNLTGPGNEIIPVSVADVDSFILAAVSIAINFGSQVGASFVMLLVVLTMTTRSRFARASTMINIAGLLISIVRCFLTTLYYTSSFLEFYAYFARDFRFVDPNDTRISAVTTFFSLPQLILIEIALMLQASSMFQLWPRFWRALTVVVSVLVAVGAVGFKFASTVMQMQATFQLASASSESVMWVRKCDLVFSTTTVFWFCFIFIFRLILHMWEYRTILPPLGGLSAMEVLVMTNGILMLVPVIFAVLEFLSFSNFESASLTSTTVVILLPLGALIAQHMTTPNGSSRRTQGSSSRGTYGGGTLGGTMDTALSSSHKKRFFGSWSQPKDSVDGAFVTLGGGPPTQVRIQSGGVGGIGFSFSDNEGRRRGSSGNTSLTRKAPDVVDQELERIDAVDIEADGGVWVGRGYEVRRERRDMA